MSGYSKGHLSEIENGRIPANHALVSKVIEVLNANRTEALWGYAAAGFQMDGKSLPGAAMEGASYLAEMTDEQRVVALRFLKAMAREDYLRPAPEAKAEDTPAD